MASMVGRSDKRSAKAAGDEPSGEPSERFESLAQRLLSVPKKEIDKRAAAHERNKARKKAG
jgi:hypothetical protein